MGRSGLAGEGERETALGGAPPDLRGPRRGFPAHQRGRRLDDHAMRRAAVDEVVNFDAGGFTATELVMFQSVLQRTGPTYAVIARMPFGGPASS